MNKIISQSSTYPMDEEEIERFNKNSFRKSGVEIETLIIMALIIGVAIAIII